MIYEKRPTESRHPMMFFGSQETPKKPPDIPVYPDVGATFPFLSSRNRHYILFANAVQFIFRQRNSL
jgi:hypothetical protein